MSTALFWFRRDLRLADNPGFARACSGAARLLPVYIDAPARPAAWPPGAASRWWLHHSLAALDGDLRARGSALIVRRGEPVQVLRELASAHGVRRVYWSRRYAGHERAEDDAAESALAADGVEVGGFNAALMCEPWTVRTGAGGPYRVFTPFWRACRERAAVPAPQPAPHRLPPLPPGVAGVPLAALELLPRRRWDAGLAASWTPGERGAAQRLDAFTRERLAAYPQAREWPGVAGTSRLSPHLHFGEIGPRQVAWTLRRHAAASAGAEAGADAMIRELGWREFAHHVLYHFPHTAERPLDPRFDGFPWRMDGAALLRAWRRGRTGFPIVDAGMRELWHTGWMHNRVRMIVASFLAKNCRVAWQEGARWFWDTLVDADLANNTLGWQWAAGCGADAAPYFRVFNPVRQGERFDPQGAYVRRWVPELAPLPDRWVHRPWELPAQAAAALHVRIGRDYPLPVVDLAASRNEALAAYRAAAGGRGE